MIARYITPLIQSALTTFPVIGLLGSRQVGKTTLAKDLVTTLPKEAIYVDLERPSDRAKLTNAELFFELNQHKTIIIDEVQVMPELFPLLRSVVDANRVAARFILLGSASPEILRRSSESLAGRIMYFELSPLLYVEINSLNSLTNHWMYGGYPEPFLFTDKTKAWDWYNSFLQTYISKDLPALGLNTYSLDVYRLAVLLAHNHGQVENFSAFGKALGVSAPTIKTAIDYFERSFIIRRLQPWYNNAKKRLVKSAKLYYRDSGILHTLLNIIEPNSLLANPIVGFSFEGYCIEQIINTLGSNYRFHFYRTQDGTEADLIAVKGNIVEYAFEIKLAGAPSITKSMKHILQDLTPAKMYVITPNQGVYPLHEKITVAGIMDLQQIFSA